MRRLWTIRLAILFFIREDNQEIHYYQGVEEDRGDKQSLKQQWLSCYEYANEIAGEDYPEKSPKEALNDAVWEQENSDWNGNWW